MSVEVVSNKAVQNDSAHFKYTPNEIDLAWYKSTGEEHENETFWHFKNNEWGKCVDNYCSNVNFYNKAPPTNVRCVAIPPPKTLWSYDSTKNTWSMCDDNKCSPEHAKPPPNSIIYKCENIRK